MAVAEQLARVPTLVKEDDLPTEEPKSPRQHRTWYRTTMFNAVVIGMVGFTAPGLWNAMNSLGAGGAEEPYLINAANALVFALMGIFCLLSGPIANTIGLKYTLLLGAVGYPLYSSGLYTNNRFGNVWFVLVGSVACGISAGCFWGAEGAVAMGFPEKSKRGRYLNIWLCFRTLGPLLGGAIILGLNHSATAKKKGKVGYQTYLIFIALQCLSVPIALALSPPEKVQRSDGSKIIVKKEKSFKAELIALWRVSKQRKLLLMLPIFWAAQFNQYSGNFQAFYFGVRARALQGFVGNFATLASSQVISLGLDYKGWPVKKRITAAFFYVIFLHVVAWTYAWVIQEKYTRLQPVYDWADKGFIAGFFTLLLWNFSQQALLNFMYYLLSSNTDNISDLTRYAGILRGQEAFSQAVSFGLISKDWYGGRVPLAVNTILLVLAIWPTWLVVRDFQPSEDNNAATNDEVRVESSSSSVKSTTVEEIEPKA